jgi:hypothetical protein
MRYLTLGISITPVESTEDKKTAKIATKPVASSVILATYKFTPTAGIKKTGKRKTKTDKITHIFFTNTFPALCIFCSIKFTPSALARQRFSEG